MKDADVCLFCYAEIRSSGQGWNGEHAERKLKILCGSKNIGIYLRFINKV